MGLGSEQKGGGANRKMTLPALTAGIAAYTGWSQEGDENSNQGTTGTNK